MICAHCGRKARQVVPCPCGLGPECWYYRGFGICDRCYRTVVVNAIDRARELTHKMAIGMKITTFPSSYPQDVDGRITA